VSEYKGGRKLYVWKNPKKLRNEATDCLVYAMVALHSQGAQTVMLLGKMAGKYANFSVESADNTPTEAANPVETTPETAPETPETASNLRTIPVNRRVQNNRKGNWMGGFFT
jgi:phage terminase large subunit GpA-like protein